MNVYLLFKSLHLISIVCWFAALFYMPRLFVYHTRAASGSQMYDTFVTMEQKLSKVIMIPSMLVTLATGITLIYITEYHMARWLHIKLTFVLILLIYHHLLIRYKKLFAVNKNQKSEEFYRIFNDVPTVVLIACVFLAVYKP